MKRLPPFLPVTAGVAKTLGPENWTELKRRFYIEVRLIPTASLAVATAVAFAGAPGVALLVGGLPVLAACRIWPLSGGPSLVVVDVPLEDRP